MYIYTYILKGVMFIGKIQSWVNGIGYASNEWQFEILYRVVKQLAQGHIANNLDL